MENNQVENQEQIFEDELQRRLEIYYDFKPGTDECPITPLTTKGLIPAIVVSAVLTIYLIAAMVGFQAFYPS